MRIDNPNNFPDWAPRRPLVVSDPSKLTYFARANAVRSGINAGEAVGAAGGAGLRGASLSFEPGGLSGFGETPPWLNNSIDSTAQVSASNRIQQLSVANSSNTPIANANDTLTPGGGQTDQSFLDKLGAAAAGVAQAFLPRQAPQTPVYVPAPNQGVPVWAVVAGAGALGVGAYFLLRKKR